MCAFRPIALFASFTAWISRLAAVPSLITILRTGVFLVLVAISGLLIGGAGTYLYLSPSLPDASTYRDLPIQTPLRLYGVEGSLLAEYGERRAIPLDLEDIPPLLVRAVLDTEDKRFYSHSGVDLISLIDDLAYLLWNREIGSGASTITMQLARNLALSFERTFVRKLKEILLAFKLERELDKDDILEAYLNLVSFGKRAYGVQAAALAYYGKDVSELELAQLAMLAGIPQSPNLGNPVNGPERALRRRHVVLVSMYRQGSITREEYEQADAAPITARLYEREFDYSSPYVGEWVRQQLYARYGDAIYSDGFEATTTIDPRQQSAAVNALRNGILSYDRRHGYRGAERRIDLGDALEIDSEALLEGAMSFGPLEPAIVTQVDEREFTAFDRFGAEHLVDWDGMRWARPYINESYRGAAPKTAADVVQRGDVIRLRTTSAGSMALSQIPDIQGALVALDPADGAIRALVGGFNFYLKQFNNALLAERQPGSGLKPFVYSAALEYGTTPASIFIDAPITLDTEDVSGVYRPQNYGGRFHGETRVREALFRSINLVSIRLLLATGIDPTMRHLEQFGFDLADVERNTQIAIGGGRLSVSPLDMAKAYAVFANGGFAVEPYAIIEVRRTNGRVLERPQRKRACEVCKSESGDYVLPAPRVLDERNAFIMRSMLQDVIGRGTGRRALALGRRDIGGKTGTTNEADAWFNGFHPGLVGVVWMGFADNRPLGDNETGSSLPLPVWVEFMREALSEVPEAPLIQPDGVVSVRINPNTGAPAAPDDSEAVFEYFFEENSPRVQRTAQGRDSEAAEDVL